jgi:hypothetical protein
MSAGRLVDRGARPAVRRRTSGLVEIALPPAPAEVSSPPDESRPLPVQRSDEAPQLRRRPSKVTQSFERTSPLPALDGRTAALPEAAASAAHGAPPLAPASAPSTGRLFHGRAAPFPKGSVDTGLVLPVDPSVDEQPVTVVPAAESAAEPRAEPWAVNATAGVQAPRPSPRSDGSDPVVRPPTPTRNTVSPSPPSVVIERIEVVTPPERPLPADPLASMAERRAGRSRHGAAR